MSNLNKVMLIGRLTRDPEMRYTPSGQPVTSLRMATNRYSSGTEGERREFTDYHSVVCWNIGKRQLAEQVAQYTKKGSLVYVEGRLQTRSWDGQDGQKRYTTELVANTIQNLERRNRDDAGDTYGGSQEPREPRPQRAPSSQGGQGSGGRAEQPEPDYDDLPF